MRCPADPTSRDSKTKMRSKEEKGEGNPIKREDNEKKRSAASKILSDLYFKRQKTEAPPSEKTDVKPSVVVQLLREQSQSSEKNATNVVNSTRSPGHHTCLVIHALAERERSVKVPNVDIVLQAMERHPLNLRVQMEGCRALSSHTKATGSLESKGIALVFAALSNHTFSLLRYFAVDCLRPLARDANSRSMFAQLPGFIETLLHALQGSPKHVKLQEQGLSMLSYLVEDAACRRQIMEHGGVTVILSAMRLYDANALIHCNGTAALCWLVHLEHQDAKEAILSNPDAIRTMCDIAKSFKDNASVFGNCMCILLVVCVGSDGSILPELGGGSSTRYLIQLGMRQHPTVIKVQRNGMLLLRLVTDSLSETNAIEDEEELKSYDQCIDVVLRAMKAFSKEADIQSLGCRILSNMAVNPSIRRRLMATRGCINQALAALLEHHADVHVQRAAVSFVHTLLHPDNYNDQERTTEAFVGGITVLKIILESITGPSAPAFSC